MIDFKSKKNKDIYKLLKKNFIIKKSITSKNIIKTAGTKLSDRMFQQ